MIHPSSLALRDAKEREEEQDALVLERRRDGRLWAGREGRARPVRLRRLFPWSSAADHVSLRDEDGGEVALVGGTKALDDVSEAALEDALDVTTFVLEVRRILDVEEEVEIRVWKVETRQGTRTFQTRLDDWPWEVPAGGYLLRDVAGDLYRIPEMDRLDERSRTLMWGFVG